MATTTQQNVGHNFDQYLDEVKYKSAVRLSLMFTIVFFLLTVAHYYESWENFITMGVGLIICLGNFLFTVITKKHHFVYWTFCILGVNIVGIALNLLHGTTHYGDFIWMFSANALAFFGLPKRVSLTLLLLTFGYIAWFVFFNVNENLATVQPRNAFQKVSLFAELIAGLVSGIYVVSIMINFHKYSKEAILKTNQELIEQNKTIRIQDEEKSTLVKEVHHRVKNNLQIISSLLRMQSNEIQNEESKKHFQEAINRVMTMALIHQKLYQGDSLSDIKLKQYFDELSADLVQIFSMNKPISVNFHITTEKVGLKSVVPLGLIFNELLSNSLKHAFKEKSDGRIDVSLTNTGNSYFFTYKDNGTWNNTKSEGFGLELINTLTDQLEGQYSLKKDDIGTVYEFELKNLNE